MIYLFNDVKELTGTVRNNHILNLLYEREKNWIYSVSAEIPVTYNDQGTSYNYNKKIQKSDFLGHYDREGRFQLHKIAAVDIENGSIFVKGIHIIFDEAKAGAIIKDRRFINREIIDGARVAFESIGWSVTDFDVSIGKTYNFYNVTPLEARQILVETFGFEFDYWLDFDGKKVTNRHVAVKEKIGEKTNKRYTYGHNVLNIRAEQDYSEIYTAVIGRGKGEEIEETGGYGRRIEYTDVVWTTPNKPLNKPAGTRILEDPNATQLFGYKENGVVKPRIKVEVFSDIESPTELIQASYEWLMGNNVPKAVFSLKVADGDGLNLGDEVYVIYRDIDLIKSARVEKVIDDLVSGNRDVEFGDTAYFDTDRRLSGIQKNLKRIGSEQGGAIYNLKKDFDRRFEEEVETFRAEFEQAKIDIFAEIEADRVNMEALLDTKLTEFNTAFNADMEAAYEEAQRNYIAIENYVNTTVDTNREQVEQFINDAEQYAKDYAEQQAQEKANAVRTDLETVTSGHQAMLQDLENNVLDIDEYLGTARGITLDQRLLDMTQTFDERIQNSNRSASNMLRGSRFDEPSMFNSSFAGVSLHTSEHENFIRLNTVQSNIPLVIMNGELHLHAGVEYHLHIEYRTDTVTEFDGFVFYHNDGTTERLENRGLAITGLTTSGAWEHASLTLSPNAEMSGRLAIGTRRTYGTSPDGIIDVRLPYLTATAHDQWLPHPRDENQNITEISRRITDLEEGYSDFIVRSVWDAEMYSLNQTIRDYRTTVDGVEDTIIQLKDSEVITRGREVLDTVDGFQRKVWLGDIDRPNIIPHSSFENRSNRDAWGSWGGWQTAYGGVFLDYAIVGNTDAIGNIGITSPPIGDYLIPGETYTLSWEASTHYPATTDTGFDYTYLVNVGENNASRKLPTPTNVRVGSSTNAVYRKYELTFVAPSDIVSDTKILFGTHTTSQGINAFFRFRHPKLEVGELASPFKSSFSMLEQRSDEISLAVQGLDFSGMLTQSDIRIEPGYVQLGSQRLGDSQLASIFRVSPNSINAITDRMILNGDLYVDGDITALAVDAIEGRFSNLFASELETIELRARHIGANAIGAQHLWIDTALINKLSSSNMFTDFLYAKTLNAIEANIGRVRTAFLTSNVIESDHIQVGTALVDKMFATSARIDELITKSHFVTNVKAMSIEAVEGQFSSLITKYLSANYIDVDYIVGKNAWFETQYTMSANIAKLTAQTAFIRDIQAIEITSNQLNINTLHSKLKGTEGGLTIYGPDGRVLINNSILENTFAIQFIQPRFEGVGVELSANYYKTTNTSYTTAAAFSYQRGGRYLTVEGYCEMRGEVSGSSTRTQGNIRILEYSSGSRSSFTTIESRDTNNGGNQFFRIRIDMGVPQYEQRNFYVQFRTLHSGNAAHFRINQAYYHG